MAGLELHRRQAVDMGDQVRRDRLRIAAQYLAVDERRIADRFGKTADHAASQLLQPLFEIRAAERNRLHHEKQTLTRAGRLGQEIGRASCRERVCQYVEISVVAVSLKKKKQTEHHISNSNTKQNTK